MKKKNSNTEQHWIHFKNGNLNGLYLYTTDDFSKIFKDGNTDKEMMSSIEDDGATGKTIFDVGAYIGSSSLVFSKMVGKKGKVVAFEPNPYNLRRIEKNLQKNSDYAKNIQICTFALSDNNDKTKMLLSEEIDNGHSSTSRIAGAHSTIANESLPEGFVELEVENKKLDDYVDENKIAPDIMKIDIEGAEHLMLAGSLKTLAKYKPILYIEIHSEYCAVRCYDILNDLGYRIYVINEEPDNRIMIKAVCEKEPTSIGKDDSLQNIKNNLQSISDIALKQARRLEDELGLVNKLINLSDKLEELTRENTKLIANQAAQEKELVRISNELNSIYSSRSWKMTSALRKVSKLSGR